MINLVLFYCERMQGYFGIGSHMQELINYFKRQKKIYVTIIFTESEKYKECTFLQDDKLDILHIPTPENGLFLSTDDTLIARTLALRILQIAFKYLEGKENIVCWFNSLGELNLARQLKENIVCKAIFVHHGWIWKDHTKVENDVFAKEWENGNVSFCPPAFEVTSQQLEMVAASDYTIAVTKQAYEYYHSALDVPLKKLVTIYNGIAIPEINNFDKAAIKKELQIENAEHIIVFSGRVVINKGVFFLIEAFKALLQKIPNCRLVLIGVGSLAEVLRAAVPVWAKVTLTDYMSREWLQKWYAIADIGILPSLMEQCSYTAIEMRFWKIPIIVSAVDGLDEMFEHEMDCLKLPIHYDNNEERILNPLEIVDALYRLLTDTELCNALTENGYRKALAEFTLEKMGNGYMQVLEKLVGEDTETDISIAEENNSFAN